MRKIVLVGVALLLASVLAAPGVQAFSKDSLVWTKCTQCHEPVGDKIPRVEDIRTTPEEWAVIIDRMHRLHHMDLTRDEMGELLKELSTTQILTPEEQAKVSYLSLYNNSQHVEVPSNKDEERLFTTCVRCHSRGKILSYRMTEANWAKVRDFHLYMDPAIIYQMREMHFIPEADAMLQYLAKIQPYGQAWRAPTANLAGAWRIFGYEPGKGNYRGEAEISDTGNGEYALSGSLAYSDGTSEAFQGEATLYGGYALRTRTHHNGFETRGAYILSGDEMRGEHHFPAPHYRNSRSTWVRADAPARVIRVSPSFLLSGERTTLTVEGVNLPEVKASDVSFAGGPVKVLSAKRVSPETLEVRVAAGSEKPGELRVEVKGTDAGVLKVAPRIDYIAISPATGRARVAGGRAYPAEGVQFEAIAYSRGARAKDPKDDVALGPVPANFKLAEEKTRPNDDDLTWVGGIAPNGSYVPMGDYEPNPARAYSKEDTGLVKVIGTYKKGKRTYRASAQLAVTVPDFIPSIR